MPLELTDFDQAGLEVDALALIVAAAPPAVYADVDRGGTQTPEGGDIGIGPGETRISRIRITNSGQSVILNDNDNPAELTMSEHFGPRNSVSPWTLYIQTDGSVASSAQIGNAGGNYVNFQFGAGDAAVLNTIAAGDRFLIGLARALEAPAATLPIAARFAGTAASLTAALTKQVPDRKPVAATFVGAAGLLSAALTKQIVGAKPVSATFAAEEASLTTALETVAVRHPMVALTASETTIERGRSVELRWAVTDALSAEISQGVGAVNPGIGSVRVTPAQAATYTLTARGVAGTIPAVAEVTVTTTRRAARSLLPPNATTLERVIESATDFFSVRPIDLPIRQLWSAADCPVALLPYLAWALGVEEWDSDWPEAVKRAAVASAFAIHREKGTLAGLRRLLENAGAEYEYQERPKGVPMTALLRIFNSNTVYLPNIAAAIGRVKRASLDLDMELASAAAGQIPIAGGLGAATFVEISDWGPYAL